MDSSILLIDKPTGMTSHDVVNQVRRMTGEKRVGHAGTLDPLATGLLIILVGREATKKQASFLHLDKTYECTAQFGVISDTYDAQGRQESTATWEQLQKLQRKDIEAVLPQFIGNIQQRVPAYSAVKMKGQKLYEKARRNEIKIEDLPIKNVTISSIKVEKFWHDETTKKAYATFSIDCSSGTYIRSLIHDIGQTLGIGAIITQLRRTRIGEYDVRSAKPIHFQKKIRIGKRVPTYTGY